jgi:hypothetical protein
LDGVAVTPGEITRVRLELVPRYVSSEEIVVEASDATGKNRPELRESLGRDEILRSPEFTADPLLPVARLPGVAAGEGSGGLFVRGGSSDEVKFVLDGLELYEPFHLRDRGGLVGIIDSRDVGQLDFLGGAFPTEYGGHMSGVVELHSTAPPAQLQTSVAASSNDARIANHGAFGAQGHWSVSARSGHPSQVLDALDADPSYDPRYSDLFGKLGFSLNDKTSFSLSVLASYDDHEGDDGALVETIEEPGAFRSRYTNQYFWLSLQRAWSPRFYLRTILSQGELSSVRNGSSPRVAQIEDARSTRVVGLKQDWMLQSERHLLKWGVDLKRLHADYEYVSVVAQSDVVSLAGSSVGDRQITKSPSGGDYGLYLADRLRLNPSLNVEFGLRWDAQTYASEEDRTLSPRLNVAYAPNRRDTLRAGWGYFHQPQRIHELQVEDDVDRFFAAQRAEHRLIAFQREFDSGFRLRLNAYQKLMTDLRPRFENLLDPLGFLPEADEDRVRIAPDSARAEGIELVVHSPAGERLAWWAGYTLSRAEDEIDGAWVPRAWDQRHTLDFGLNFRPGRRWAVGVSGTYHSGRPTTPVRVEVRDLPDGSRQAEPVFGARGSARFPAYLRLDARVSRSIAIRGTEIIGFVNVTNILDRENICCVERLELEIGDRESFDVDPVYRHGLPRMFTYGLSWTF